LNIFAICLVSYRQTLDMMTILHIAGLFNICIFSYKMPFGYKMFCILKVCKYMPPALLGCSLEIRNAILWIGND